jgi:DNA-binding transcriptional LysR family regulator
VALGIADGDVVPILEDWSLPPLWLSLFYPPYEALPPLVATFTEFFEAYLEVYLKNLKAGLSH